MGQGFFGARDVPARSASTERSALECFNPHAASEALRAGTARAPLLPDPSARDAAPSPFELAQPQAVLPVSSIGQAAPVLASAVLAMRHRQYLSAWLSLAWLGLAPGLAAQYSIVDLGDLGGGFSRAWAINPSGQVAGESLLPGPPTIDRAFSWQGTMTDLGTLGGQQSAAFGINSAGTVSGWAQNAAGNAMPALWNGTSVSALPTLGGTSGTAWGINDAGTAVGVSALSTGFSHATVWNGTGAHDLGTLGGPYSVAYDLNNQGTEVGTASNSSGQDRAVFWGQNGPVDLGGLSGGNWTAVRQINESGEVILWGTPHGGTVNQAAFWDGNPASPVIELGAFGGSESWAFGLNDHGFVVGWAEEANGTYHAYVWDGTEKTDLGTLGGFYSSAFGINDQGVIVGYALDPEGNTHAVEWVPAPEPGPLALGLMGGVLLVFFGPQVGRRCPQRAASANCT